jgi:DNA-binding MarR family transcriptional regulator
MGTIRAEILQTRPFASAAEEAVVTLVSTADRVRSALSGMVEAHGITLQQYNVLRILRGAGSDGLPTLDIAARMIEKSPGITRLLERLEARRLVRRLRCPEDRRQVLCYATADAVQLLAGLDAPMAESGRRCLAPLDAKRTTALVAMLDEIRAAAASSSKRPAQPIRDTKTKETRR